MRLPDWYMLADLAPFRALEMPPSWERRSPEIPPSSTQKLSPPGPILRGDGGSG